MQNETLRKNVDNASTELYTYFISFQMLYRILCNGTLQKSQEARSGLGLASSHCTSLHTNRYGISIGVPGKEEIHTLSHGSYCQ